MDEIIKPLIKRIFGVSLSKHVDTQILRYPPGGHYIPHQDVGSDLLDRYFTVVCYLNDDFEGGRTWFPSLNYSVVPQAGKAVFFPASFYPLRATCDQGGEVRDHLVDKRASPAQVDLDLPRGNYQSTYLNTI